MLTLVLFIIGIVLLIGGAEILVRGASKLAIAIGISPLVVGLTVVAFGTSSPELAVLLQASFAGSSDIAIGNVVGSNICNILLVMGLASLVTPMLVSRQLVKFDVPVMVGISFVLLGMSLDGTISRLDGTLLFVGSITYVYWSIRQSLRQNADLVLVRVKLFKEVQQFSRDEQERLIVVLSRAAHVDPEQIKIFPIHPDNKALIMEMPQNVAVIFQSLYKKGTSLQRFGIRKVQVPQMMKIIIHIEESAQDFSQDEQESFILVVAYTLDIAPELIRMVPFEPESKNFTLKMPHFAAKKLVAMSDRNDPLLEKLRFLKVERQRLAWLGNAGMIVAGLALLVLGARWLVDGAVTFATWLGVSELIIGLTVVAVGTSLPEIATSIVAGLRGERDMVVGNVVGSNIFNILLVLGLCSIIAPVTVSNTALHLDIPVMVGVALVTIPVFISANSVERWEGALFVGYYIAYTTYLVLNAMGSSALTPFVQTMTLLLPASFVVLLGMMAYSLLVKRV